MTLSGDVRMTLKMLPKTVRKYCALQKHPVRRLRCTFLSSRQYLSPLEFQPESTRHLSSIITRRPTVLFVVDDSLQETELSQLKTHGMRSPKYHASSCCCIGNLGGRASTRSLCPVIPVPLSPLLEKDFSYKGGAEEFKPIHFGIFIGSVES